MTRIAFLGLGRMGAPMAANLVRAGHHLVVWNRTAAKAAAFAALHSAEAAATPAEAVARAETVITMLADDDALTACHRAPDGVLAALAAGTLVIDMGTSSPGLIARLAQEVAVRGGSFVDAPVSGSVAAATDGVLAIMAAGSGDAVDRARPVLEALGAKVFHMGATGSGSAMKLAVNTVVHALNCALGEALVLAERAGIARDDAYAVFLESAVAAPFARYKQAAFERPGEVPADFRMVLAAKDLRLARELAVATGAELPQAARNQDIFARAVAAGFGDHDESAVAEYLRGVPVAADEADALPGVAGVDHIGFTVPDLQQAREFLEDILGCQYMYSVGPFAHDDDWMTEHLNVDARAVMRLLHFFRLAGQAVFEVFEYEGPDQGTRMPRNSDHGGHHVAVYVRDLDAAVAFLRRRGVRVLGEPTASTGPSAGQRWVYFLSPWGMQFELVSYPGGKAFDTQEHTAREDSRHA